MISYEAHARDSQIRLSHIEDQACRWLQPLGSVEILESREGNRLRLRQ